MPFYAGDVEYAIDLAAAAVDVDEALLVEIPFAGSYAEVTVAGTGSVVAFESPAVVRVPLGPVGGRHRGAGAPRVMTIRVGASAQNLFGPWHSEGLALSRTWAQSPRHQPAGTAYRFDPHGLTGPVRVEGRKG